MSLINNTGFELTREEARKILHFAIKKIGLPSEDTERSLNFDDICGSMYSINYTNKLTKVNRCQLLTEVDFLELIG